MTTFGNSLDPDQVIQGADPDQVQTVGHSDRLILEEFFEKSLFRKKSAYDEKAFRIAQQLQSYSDQKF